MENSLCPLYLKYPTPEKDLALALQNWGNHKNVIPRSKELSALRWECLLLAETETPSHFETEYSSLLSLFQPQNQTSSIGVQSLGILLLNLVYSDCFSSALLLILQLEIFSKNFFKEFRWKITESLIIITYHSLSKQDKINNHERKGKTSWNYD